MERYHAGYPDTKPGDTTLVFGWYERQEWVEVEFIRKTALGWLVYPY